MTIQNSYVVYYEPETKGWVSFCLETDVASQGETKQEAIDMLKEALELYYEGVPVKVKPIESLDFGRLKLSI